MKLLATILLLALLQYPPPPLSEAAYPTIYQPAGGHILMYWDTSYPANWVDGWIGVVNPDGSYGAVDMNYLGQTNGVSWWRGAFTPGCGETILFQVAVGNVVQGIDMRVTTYCVFAPVVRKR